MNKKIYKGYELVKMIHDNINLDDGTRIEVHDERLNPSLVTVLEYNNYRLNWKEGSFNTRALFDDYYYFRVLEDNTEEIEELDTEIGILEDNAEEIEELDEEWTYIEGQVEKIWSKAELELVNKINELVKTINEIRKEKE